MSKLRQELELYFIKEEKDISIKYNLKENHLLSNQKT